MGPRSYARNGHNGVLSRHRVRSFNGAAQLRAERSVLARRSNVRLHASMGPRSYARNGSCSLLGAGCYAQLQWGRAVTRGTVELYALLSGEVGASMGPRSYARNGKVRTSGSTGSGSLQWGRAVTRGTDGEKPDLSLVRFRLQWGRAVTRGTDHVPARATERRRASMGPRSYARNGASRMRRSGSRWASMGPRSYARNGRRSARSSSATCRFNGAAQLRAERSDLVDCHPDPDGLQWGRAVTRGTGHDLG